MVPLVRFVHFVSQSHNSMRDKKYPLATPPATEKLRAKRAAWHAQSAIILHQPYRDIKPGGPFRHANYVICCGYPVRCLGAL